MDFSLVATASKVTRAKRLIEIVLSWLDNTKLATEEQPAYIPLETRRSPLVRPMAKPRYADVEVRYSNPPQKSGLFRLTICRKVAGVPGYVREVEPHELLSAPEAAKVLRISVRYLYRLVEEGRIPSKKKNKRLWFISRDVQQLVLKRRRSKRDTAKRASGHEAFLIH